MSYRPGAIAALLLSVSAAHAANDPPTPPAFPLAPFNRTIDISDFNLHTVGIGGGKLIGITSITFTNFSTDVQQINLYRVTTAASGCSGPITAYLPGTYLFLVPARSTLHVPYPTPVVIPNSSSGSCISFYSVVGVENGSMTIVVNGFTQ